nr:DUF5683 domain-containing protein [Maribacter sp. HTCC2170]
MNKTLTTFVCSFLFMCISFAQDKDSTPTAKDSLKMVLNQEGIVIQDSVFTKRKVMNPLAPSKAAFYSAVLPGLGQVYNKRYWKVPIVYAVIGTGVYAYTYNDDLYDRFRTAFKRRQAGFTDDEFYDINGDNAVGEDPDLDMGDLEKQQERYQTDRDLALVITIAMYALNIIDANVDAHLKQFNIDEDLSMDVKPFLDLNPITNNPDYGIAFTIKF